MSYNYKSKLSQELVDKLCKCREEGMPETMAADYCMVLKDTFRSWLKEGRRIVSDKKKPNTKHQVLCAQLASRWGHAKAKCASFSMQKILDSNHPFAHQWHVGTMYPKELGEPRIRAMLDEESDELALMIVQIVNGVFQKNKRGLKEFHARVIAELEDRKANQ